jgi:hypothetical protein
MFALSSPRKSLVPPPPPKALEGRNRHQRQRYRQREDERTDGTTPAVVVRSDYKPYPVGDEEQGNQEAGQRNQTHAGQSVTNSGVIRVALTLRTIME